jgi:Phage capsid family
VFASTAVAGLFAGLASASAAAGLIKLAPSVQFARNAAVLVPTRALAATDGGGFVGEGSPAQVRQLNLTSITLNSFKFCVIIPYANELGDRAIDDAATIFKQMINEAIQLNLDAAIFSSTASSSIRPAGILAGLSSLTPTAGGGVAAMSKDLEQLVDTVDAVNPVFVAAPGAATVLKNYVGPKFDAPILATTALAAGTIICLERDSFVSGFSPVAEFTTGEQSALHFEDSSPLPLATTTTAVASPIKSLWQQDISALKCLFRISWGLRSSSTAFISSVTW